MIDIRTFNVHPKYKPKRRAAINAAQYVVKNEFDGDGEINIIFVDDKRMKSLNGIYLNHWHTTDVLCFEMEKDQERIEGEIYVSLDRAKWQSNEYMVTFREEILRLVIHGVLHLLGYRDRKRSEKIHMSATENYYLSKIASKFKN